MKLASGLLQYIYVIEIYYIGYVLHISHIPPQTKFYIRHIIVGAI